MAPVRQRNFLGTKVDPCFNPSTGQITNGAAEPPHLNFLRLRSRETMLAGKEGTFAVSKTAMARTRAQPRSDPHQVIAASSDRPIPRLLQHKNIFPGAHLF